MTETIQKLPTDTVTAEQCRTAVTTGDGVAAARRAFLEHAAELYDTRLAPAQLDAAAALDDAAALALCLSVAVGRRAQRGVVGLRPRFLVNRRVRAGPERGPIAR